MTLPASDPATIERAVQVLRSGGLVAYPTDTVYGLAALPTDDEAVRMLYEAKNRPLGQPVPLLLSSVAGLGLVAAGISSSAHLLIDAFWPGGLTVVLGKAQNYHSLAVHSTVAVRVPDHPVPRELARLLGGPITGTSANASGGPEPLTADDVRAQLGELVGLIIDGGRCPGGTPSTLVDCTAEPPRVLRKGAVSREALVAATDIDFE